MGSQAGGGQDMALSEGCSGALGHREGQVRPEVPQAEAHQLLAFQLIKEGSEGGESGGGSY